jgi:5,5'-dehydrodivanillate O-demethylase oxygenase subunit
MDAQPKSNAEFDPRMAFYTGPGTLGGRYLRSFWQPIYAGKLVKPGRARPVRVLGEEFTLYRGEEGQPHLVDHRCAHRGTQLSAGTVEGDAIRCFYHGWKYGADGQCLEQPGEAKPFCDKIRIRSFPVKEYLGVVFAYFGEGEPPPFPRYERFERWDGTPNLSLMAEIAPYNFFQRIENSHDFVHLPFVHKQAFPPVKPTLDTIIPRVTTKECSWGMETHRVDPNGFDLVAYFGMPNINYISIGKGAGKEWEGGGELLFIRVPVDDHSHMQFMWNWTDGDHSELPQGDQLDLVNKTRNEIALSILNGDTTMDAVIAAGTPGLFDIEDDVAQLGQGVLWNREGEHLGSSDVSLALMRRLWTRDLRALSEGRPRHDWHRTSDMIPKVAALPRDVR